MRGQAFDIASAPLFRVGLIQIAAEEHVLGVCMDHVISDATTVHLFIQGLLQAYDRLGQDIAAHAAVPRLQYWHYAAWEARDAEAEVAFLSTYWNARLAEETRTQPVPFDAAPGVPRVNRSLHFPLQRNLAARLRHFAQQERCFSLSVGLAALQLALYQTFGISAATTILLLDTRPSLGLDGLMGPLLGFSFAQLGLEEGSDFRSLCRQAVAETHTALRHTVPSPKFFSQGLRWSQEKRAQMPAFNWIRDRNFSSDSFAGVERFPLQERAPSGSIGFVLAVYEGETDLRVRLDYAANLFCDETMQRLGHSFITLLSDSMHHPERSIALGGAEAAAI
jgi:hypothetical protein